MSLSIGIVGLPNVGKSTLFETLTKKQVDRANYPFCTIDPNVGVVAVPDERVDKLTNLMKSAKKIYATVEFVDIAGLVKGAHEGEGLGNKFLANIRETDAIIYVLRAFSNDKIVNTQNSIDILRDKEVLDIELTLKDLDTVSKRLHEVHKDARAGKKEALQEEMTLQKCRDFLSSGKILSELIFESEEERILKSLQLLTMKPRLYLLNGKEEEINPAARETFLRNKWQFVIIDIASEFESAGFSAEERISLELNADSGLDILIKKSYELLNLITFLTTGTDETKAWTLKEGEKAPRAGGVIHTDFEKNFIRADVIQWEDLWHCGGYPKAREKGLLRTEGKEYIVQDGDVIEIKHGA